MKVGSRGEEAKPPGAHPGRLVRGAGFEADTGKAGAMSIDPATRVALPCGCS
jgi:hypothetical protein